MSIYTILSKKKTGKSLSTAEIDYVMEGFMSGDIPDYQMSALLMAISICGMDERETSDLTMAMVKTGERVDLSSIKGVKVDKHSTGGVGDSTTLIVSPLVAALGVPVAKMSGRGLGHTGGTIDKLESIVGFKTDLSMNRFIELVNEIQISLIGQTRNLAPGDKKLYALRDITATVDSIPLIASSIMSKKLAGGADKILLDVKVGKGAFMKSLEMGEKLARTMVDIGNRVGKKTMAILTNMDYPLGQAIGNELEVLEAMEVLKGKGPNDLRALSLELSALMLYIAGFGEKMYCQQKAIESLESGMAYRKFLEMVKHQGGDITYFNLEHASRESDQEADILSPSTGFIKRMDADVLGEISGELGAGRKKLGDVIDNKAGVYCHKKPGDFIENGEKIFTVYGNPEKIRKLSIEKMLVGVEITAEKPLEIPLILGYVE